MKILKRLLLVFILCLLFISSVFGATKRIIVLSQTSNGTDITYTILFWFAITSNPVPKSSGSIWIASGTSTGASAAENTAIQNGSILEESHPFSFAVGTAPSTIQSVVQQAWNNRNAQIAGQGENQFYGSFWDGAIWGTQ